jgi:hypothetical protein
MYGKKIENEMKRKNNIDQNINRYILVDSFFILLCSIIGVSIIKKRLNKSRTYSIDTIFRLKMS